MTAASVRREVGKADHTLQTASEAKAAIINSIAEGIQTAAMSSETAEAVQAIIDEAFEPATITAVKSALGNVIMESIIAMLRAGKLAVVGMTKADLRTALEDPSVDPQSLFDITDVITDEILEISKEAIGNQVCTGAACVENSILQAASDITVTAEVQLNNLEHICGRSKILSRHEEELQEQLDIVTASGEKLDAYFNTAAKIPKLQAGISSVQQKLNDEVLSQVPTDIDEMELADIVEEDADQKEIRIKALDTLKNLEKMVEDTTTACIAVAQAASNIQINPKPPQFIEASKLKWNRSLANDSVVDPSMLTDFHETVRNVFAVYGKHLHCVILHAERTMNEFLCFNELSKERPPGQHDQYESAPAACRDLFIFHNENLYTIFHLMMGSTIQHFQRSRKTTDPDIESRGHPGDGLSILYAICHHNSTMGAPQKRKLEVYFTSVYGWFAKGSPAKTIDKIRPVLEKALKLKVRVDWYSVTRNIIDTLIRRSINTFGELKQLWLKPPGDEFSLNALPLLDSVFADIVSMFEESATYPADLRSRDHVRATAHMTIICDDDSSGEANALITPVRPPPRKVFAPKKSTTGKPGPQCAAKYGSNRCNNKLTPKEAENAQRRRSKAKEQGRTPEMAICGDCFSKMNKTGKQVTCFDGSTRRPFKRNPHAQARITTGSKASKEVVKALVEQTGEANQGQSFREGLAQKLLESATPAKANLAICGKNDVRLGRKANGAGPRTPFAQAMMSTANAPADVNGPQQGPGVTPQEHEFTEHLCLICQEVIEQKVDGSDSDGQKGATLECGHKFHSSCILHWAHGTLTQGGRNSCPTCRRSLWTEDQPLPAALDGGQFKFWLVDTPTPHQIRAQQAEQDVKLLNIDFAGEPNFNMDQFNKALQALHNIRNICATDQCNKNYDLMLGTILEMIDMTIDHNEEDHYDYQAFKIDERMCVARKTANKLAPEYNSWTNKLLEEWKAEYSNEADPVFGVGFVQRSRHQLVVGIRETDYRKMQRLRHMAREMRIIFSCRYGDIQHCLDFNAAHIQVLMTFIHIDNWIQARDFDVLGQQAGPLRTFQAQQLGVIATITALVVPRQLAGRGNCIKTRLCTSSGPETPEDEPKYQWYRNTTFTPVRGQVLPEYYMRIMLRAKMTTRSLETAPKSMLVSIFDDHNVIDHPDIYNGAPIFPFVAQRIMKAMTKSQRRAVGLSDSPHTHLPCDINRDDALHTWGTWDTCFRTEPGEHNRLKRASAIGQMVRYATADHSPATTNGPNGNPQWPEWAPRINVSPRSVSKAYTMSHSSLQHQVNEYVDSNADCWFATLGVREGDDYNGIGRFSKRTVIQELQKFHHLKRTHAQGQAELPDIAAMEQEFDTYQAFGTHHKRRAATEHVRPGVYKTSTVFNLHGGERRILYCKDNLQPKFSALDTETHQELPESDCSKIISDKGLHTVHHQSSLALAYELIDAGHKLFLYKARNSSEYELIDFSDQYFDKVTQSIVENTMHRAIKEPGDWDQYSFPEESILNLHETASIPNGIYPGQKFHRLFHEEHKPWVVDYDDSSSLAFELSRHTATPRSVVSRFASKPGSIRFDLSEAPLLGGIKDQHSISLDPDDLESIFTPEYEEMYIKATIGYLTMIESTSGVTFTSGTNAARPNCRSIVLHTVARRSYMQHCLLHKMMIYRDEAPELEIHHGYKQALYDIRAKYASSTEATAFMSGIENDAHVVKDPRELVPSRKHLLVASVAELEAQAVIPESHCLPYALLPLRKLLDQLPDDSTGATKHKRSSDSGGSPGSTEGKSRQLDKRQRVRTADTASDPGTSPSEETSGASSAPREQLECPLDLEGWLEQMNCADMCASCQSRDLRSVQDLRQRTPQLTYTLLEQLAVAARVELGIKHPTFDDTRVRQRLVDAMHGQHVVVRPQSNTDFPSAINQPEFAFGAAAHLDFGSSTFISGREGAAANARVIKTTHKIDVGPIGDINYADFEYIIMPRMKIDTTDGATDAATEFDSVRAHQVVTTAWEHIQMIRKGSNGSPSQYNALIKAEDSDIYQVSMDDIMCELGFGSPNTDEQSTVLQTCGSDMQAHLSPRLQDEAGCKIESDILDTACLITFVLDGGATHLLMGTQYSELLKDPRPSSMTVTGFNSNDAPLHAEESGTAFMQAIGISCDDSVGTFRVAATTIPGLSYNLFPERSLYEAGYDITKNINGESAMTKYASDGAVQHRIPIYYDPVAKHHVVHMVVSRTHDKNKMQHLADKWQTVIRPLYQRRASQDSRGYKNSSDSEMHGLMTKYKSELQLQQRYDRENQRCTDDIRAQYTVDSAPPTELAQEPTSNNCAKPVVIDDTAPSPEPAPEPTPVTSTAMPVVIDDTAPSPEPAPESTLVQPDDSMTEITEAIIVLEKESTLGNSKNASKEGSRMTSLEAHKDKMHIGYHPGCDECKQVRASQNRVYAKTEQIHESRPGHTWSMDTWTTDAEDTLGRKYCTILRDHKTGHIKEIFSVQRSDLPQQISDAIIDLRTTPEFDNFDYEIVSTLHHIDLAGEWSEMSREFKEVMKDLQIQYDYCSPHDKRMNNHAENAVKCVEIKVKASMASTNVPVQWWSDVATSVVIMLNLTPMTKNIVSRDQDAIRPIEELSAGKISRTECNKRIAAHAAPGTPCLVQKSRPPRASSVRELSRTRNGIALRMLGKLVVFEDPENSSIHFYSNGFTKLSLSSGQNAWDLFKAKSPYVTYSYNVEDHAGQNEDVTEFRPFTKHVHIEEQGADDLAWHYCSRQGSKVDGDPEQDLQSSGMKRAQWQVKKSSKKANKKAGRGRKHQPANSTAPMEVDPVRLLEEMGIEVKTKALSKPRQCKGWNVYKHWDEHGVCHGTVTKALRIKDPSTQKMVQGWEIRWDSDGKTSLFGREEMIKYAIRRVDGSTQASTPPPTTTVTISEDAMLKESKNQVFKGIPVYITKNNDTFKSICINIGIKPQEHKFYLQWLEEEHNIGRKQRVPHGWGSKPMPERIHTIKDPFAHGKQSRFAQGVHIPIPNGSESWLRVLGRHKENSDRGNTQKSLDEQAHAHMVQLVSQFNRREQSMSEMDDDHAKGMRALTEYVADEIISTSSTLHAEMEFLGLDGELAQSAAQSAQRTKALVAGMQNKESTTSSSSSLGMEYPKHDDPKDLREARLRTDKALWEDAVQKEMDSIQSHGTFSRDFTRKELIQMGIKRTPIGCRFVLERKWNGDLYTKHKARMVVMGHRGFLQPGRDFQDTYAPTPAMASTRLLQALSLGPHPANGKKLYNICFDVSTAYLCAPLPQEKPEDIMVIRMPIGMRKYRDPSKQRAASYLNHSKPWAVEGKVTSDLLDDGKREDEVYFCLRQALYGLPVSSKHWYKELRGWVMKVFNENGWKCKVSRAEPSMFIMISPRGDYTYMNCHSDDADLLTTSPTDGAEIVEMFQNKYGIKVANPNYMLGLNRDAVTVNGVKTIQMTQTAYNTELYEIFKEHMPSYTPKTPFPETVFLSLSNPDGKRKEVPQEEVDMNYDKGYMKAVGALLWSARCTAPELQLGVNYLQRVMSRPTNEAFKAAMHMIKYLYLNRSNGICFNENGERQLRVYYDSSNKADYSDGKAQYGFVGMMMGGPIFWGSRKHRHVGTSSTACEYMALKHAVVETVWIRDLLAEMGMSALIAGPTIMLGDNDQATSLAYEDRVTGGNKMIKQDYHYSKEQLEEGIIDTRRVATLDNISDPMTKALSRQYIERLLPIMKGTAMKALPPVPPPRPAL